jgi:hypothetical protein
MTKNEALKMAIEALEQYIGVVQHKVNAETWGDIEDGGKPAIKAIQACKEALEQPAQEPVALLEAISDLEHRQWIKWAQSIIDSEPISDARKQRWLAMMVDYKDLPDNIQEYDREWARKVMALYPHPAPSWQGLSDDERYLNEGRSPEEIEYARAIEQALKDKNL